MAFPAGSRGSLPGEGASNASALPPRELQQEPLLLLQACLAKPSYFVARCWRCLAFLALPEVV